MPHFVISANRTLDGGVIYLAGERTWTEQLSAAATFDAKAGAETGLHWARTQEHFACDPHLIKVEQTPAGPIPKDTKQAIRAAGPDAMLAALGFLDAAPDAPHIHRAELPEPPPRPPATDEHQARA